MRTFLALLAAVNPPALAASLRGRERVPVMAGATIAAAALAAALAGLAGPILDALEVGPATFRVAAAVVLGVTSVQRLVVGGTRAGETAGPPRLPPGGPLGGWGRVAVPLLVPLLFTPQLAMVSISAGADHGAVAVTATSAGVMALAGAAATLPSGPAPVWAAAARFVAAAGVLVALALAVDGIRTI